MSSNATAELHPSAEREERGEAQEQTLRIMVESMVRDGRTEREITQAVQRAAARL
jgi:hypothetical protein